MSNGAETPAQRWCELIARSNDFGTKKCWPKFSKGTYTASMTVRDFGTQNTKKSLVYLYIYTSETDKRRTPIFCWKGNWKTTTKHGSNSKIFFAMSGLARPHVPRSLSSRSSLMKIVYTYLHQSQDKPRYIYNTLCSLFVSRPGTPKTSNLERWNRCIKYIWSACLDPCMRIFSQLHFHNNNTRLGPISQAWS